MAKQPPWAPNAEVGSRSGSDYAGPAGTPGLETFLTDAFGRSGSRQIKGGSSRRGARYTSGPFRGMTQDKALVAGRRMYAGMPDAQKLGWEKMGRMEDVRSGRELAAADPASKLTETQKTGRWQSGDGKMKQGFDDASPAYKAQLIGMYGSEEEARAQFGEKSNGKGGYAGPDGRRPDAAQVEMPATKAATENFSTTLAASKDAFSMPMKMDLNPSAQPAKPEGVSLEIGTAPEQAAGPAPAATSPATTVAPNAGTRIETNSPAPAAIPGGASSAGGLQVGDGGASPPPPAANPADYKAPVEFPKPGGMIDGRPAAEALALARKGNELRDGLIRKRQGAVSDAGEFIAPVGGGELIGMDGEMPLYAQRGKNVLRANAEMAAVPGKNPVSSNYAGPVPQKPNPTQASAATGVETPGAALKKKPVLRAA